MIGYNSPLQMRSNTNAETTQIDCTYHTKPKQGTDASLYAVGPAPFPIEKSPSKISSRSLLEADGGALVLAPTENFVDNPPGEETNEEVFPISEFF